MPRVDPNRWRAVSPLLDRALDLTSEQERAAWLATLREQDPALAADVERLINEMDGLRDGRFLDNAAAPLPFPLLDAMPGATIGAYTLVSPIGRGGMGTVWLAERADGRFDRRVAIKFLNLALAGLGEERFKREGRILARLAHPHIAQLLDAGVSPAGQPYLVLEHVDGESIDRYCDRHGLDVHARLRLFLDVLDAVAHAHASLIVHRDIKPSNVLVTREGQVKLLDFGIAKLLEDDDGGAPTAITIDGAAALTPAYAAPEQVTGQPVSTATDVFSLGVLLYELLTGKHPAGARTQPAADLLKAIVETDPLRPSEAVVRDRAGDGGGAGAGGGGDADVASTRASSRATSPDKLRRLLRGDLDTIVGKTLKKRPAERFTSVTALAEDVRRYLRHEPIGARPDSLVYRGRKFVRRNRLVVGAALITVASLSAGLYLANRERVVAERRFDQVRQLANKLFDIDIAVRGLPGSVAARQLIVNTSLEYLGRLADDARDDPELALDVGTAYMRVARVQGIPISPNLGQLEQADKTLTTAKALIDSVLAARPDNRTAFFRQAQIAHDRMIVAGLRRPDDQALPFARQSAAWLDRYLAGGPVDPTEGRQVVLALNNVGNRFRLENEFDEALRLTRRGLEIARAAPDLRNQLGGLLIGMGRIQRDRGALDDALETYGQAVSTLDPSSRPGREPVFERTFALAMIDRGETLAGESRVSAGRPAEAIALLRKAFTITDENAHKDVNDAESRSLLSSGGRPLAELLRDVDAAQSLEIYDHMLRHLGEIANNSLFRRNEVRALAGSTYALRRLGRGADVRQRIDAAFTRLRELKLYPAEKIEVGSEPHDALLALAEHHAAQGDTRRALEACDDLLRGIAAAESRPEERLRDAAAMSHLYASIADIQRRNGQAGRAAALEARRRQLWEAWDRKLPGNPFVMARLSAARVD
jgi:serine/threonine protein kinase/tetratricopeptide (TPR) repeat protein